MKNEQDMQKVLDALFQDAPFPIYRECTVEFIKNNYDKFTKAMQKDVEHVLSENPGGAAYVDLTPTNAKRLGRPRKFFLLEKGCSDPALHVYFMLHEFGHYACDAIDCDCWESDDRVKQEYHADKYALTQMLKMGWLPALSRAILHIESADLSSWKFARNPYVLAARKIMKLKLWEIAIKAHYSKPENAHLVKNGKVRAWMGTNKHWQELTVGELKTPATA